MKRLTIILDPAHGSNIPGKCSPDEKHREYLWSRDICRKLKSSLENKGYNVQLTTDLDTEPGLIHRKKKAEEIARTYGSSLLLSLHNNAAGLGELWMNARGYEVWTTPGETKSDLAATQIWKSLKKSFPDYKSRKDESDGDVDKEANFTVLTGKGYSAVLLEWLFQDNKEDVKLLQDQMVNDKFTMAIMQAVEILNITL